MKGIKEEKKRESVEKRKVKRVVILWFFKRVKTQ